MATKEKKKKSEKKELKPEMIKVEAVDKNALIDLKDNIDNFEFEDDSEKVDTYYKNALKNLFDDKKISSMTEYNSDLEVLEVAGLNFISEYGQVPLIGAFLKELDKRKLSKNRWSRKEIIMSLQERRQEEIEKRNIGLMNIGRGM